MRRSRRAIRSSRSASEVAIEQHPVAEGFLHQRTGLLGSVRHLTGGMQHQVDREIRLGDSAPEIGQQRKTITAGQPGIRCCDQQVDIGIRTRLSAGPGAKEADLGSGDQLADGDRHTGEALLNRGGGDQGHGDILLELSGINQPSSKRSASCVVQQPRTHAGGKVLHGWLRLRVRLEQLPQSADRNGYVIALTTASHGVRQSCPRSTGEVPAPGPCVLGLFVGWVPAVNC